MDSLPDTTIAEIISHLPFKDKSCVRLINHRWKRSAEVVLRKVHFLFVHGLFPYESLCEKDSLRLTPFMKGHKEKLLCTKAKLPTLLVTFIRKYCPALTVLMTTLSISWDDLIIIGNQLQFFLCCTILDSPLRLPIDFRQIFHNLHDFIIFKRVQSLLCPTRMIQSGIPLVTLELSLHSLTCEVCRSFSYHRAIFGEHSTNPQLSSTVDKLSNQLRHVRCFTNETFSSSNGFNLPHLESLHIYFWISGLPRFLVNSPNLKQLVVSPSSPFMSLTDAKQFVECLKSLKQLRYLEMLIRDGQTAIEIDESVILPLGQTNLTKFKYHSTKFSCFLAAKNSFYGSNIKIQLFQQQNGNQNLNMLQPNAVFDFGHPSPCCPLFDFANSSLKQMDLKFEEKVDWSRLISCLTTLKSLKFFSICFKDLLRSPYPLSLPSMVHMTQLTEMHIVSTTSRMNPALSGYLSSRVRPFKMISLPPNIETFTWSMPYCEISSLLNPTFANSLRVLVLSVNSEIPFRLWFPQLNELYLTISLSHKTKKGSFDLDCIVNLTTLTHLYLNYCHDDYVEKISSIISSFEKLKKLALIESHTLNCNTIPPPSHEQALRLHRLTTQIVTYCQSLQTLITNSLLTDECFLMLSSSQKLSHLQVKMTQDQMVEFLAHLPMNRVEQNILIANQTFITLPAAVSKIFTMQTYSITNNIADMMSSLHDTLLLALMSKKISKYSFVPDLKCTCENIHCVLK